MTTPRPIDADNHYYEALDAFTRHLPKEFKRRGVRPVQSGKRVELLIADRVNRFIPNPTFDPIIVPGCLDQFFRGQMPEGADRSKLTQVEPLRREYRDRDARVAVAEEQGLDAVLLFPTLGCGVEEGLRGDVPATMASLSAFNRWLEEDWGFDYRGRLIGVPMLSLADPVAAVAEVDSLLSRGEAGFGERYFGALQSSPDLVLAHAALQRAITELPASRPEDASDLLTARRDWKAPRRR